MSSENNLNAPVPQVEASPRPIEEQIPPPGFQQPPQGFQQPPPGFQPPPQGFQQPPPGFQPTQAGYQPPQQPGYHPIMPNAQPQPQPQPPAGYPQQPGVQVQQVYAQPLLVPLNSNQVLFNQACPTGTNTTIIYKRTPINMICPYCRKEIKTVVVDRFNGASCIFCLATAFCIFAFLQISRGKDLLCCDSRHKCPNCGNFLGAYIAC